MGAVREVADGVFAWIADTGGWGWSNAGLVVADGAPGVLVDTLFDADLTASMMAALPQVPIGTLVNTHANGDHWYGNAVVGASSIIASARATEEMAALPPAAMAALVAAAPEDSFFRRIFSPFRFDGVAAALPTQPFEGAVIVKVGDVDVEVVELGPAHTAGDVIAVVPARRVVFTGDLLFSGGHPIVWAGPVTNWIGALDHVLGLDIDVVVPGHGPVTDKAGVRELRAYFTELLEQARPLYDEGLTPLEAARRIRIERAVGWGESERIVVNVAACFRDFGAPGSDMGQLFAGMEALATS